MASRKEEKEKRRQERLAAEQAASEKARRRRIYGIFAAGFLVAATGVVIGALIATGGGGSDKPAGKYNTKAQNTIAPPPQKIRDLFQAAKQAGCDLKNPRIEGRNHVTGKVKYGTNPPTSGNHYPIPTPDGVYANEPQPTHFVHTLEHGRVELQYSPSLTEKEKRQLGGLFNEDPHLMLMFPNTTMHYKVAASTWGHLIGCKKFTNAIFDALRTFRDRYRDTAPEPSITQPANF